MQLQSSIFSLQKPVPATVRVNSRFTAMTTTDPNSMAATAPKWVQKTITLPPQKRGCHLITPKIMKEIGPDLFMVQVWACSSLFASLTMNENYDSDVRIDTETFLNRIVPEGAAAPWRHTIEGPDDMPAHIKSSMFGCSLTVPLTDGRLNMGTWQGI